MFSNRDLFKLIIPIVLETMLSVAVGMADTLMVSQAGDVAVSAISLIDPINVMLIMVFSALAAGGTVVVSQYLGKKDERMANFAAKQLLIVILVISTFIGILASVFRRPFLNLIYPRVDGSIVDAAAIYLLLSAASHPFLALYNGASAIFRSINRSSVTLYCGIAMNVANVCFNALFIFGLKMGVAGAALASLIGRLVACVISLIVLKQERNLVRVDSYLNLEFDLGIVGRILKIAVPSSLENGAFQFGKVLLSRLVSTFAIVSISANGIANSISQAQILPVNAIGVAMLTVVGHCIGAGDYEQAKFYIRKLMKIGYFVVWGLGVVLLLCLNPLLTLYNVAPETIDLARQCAIIHIIGSSIFYPFAYAFANCLRAANDAKFPMVVSTVSMFLMRLGMSYVIAYNFLFDVRAVYIANYFDWVVRAVFYIWRYRSGKWMNKKLI